MKHIVLIVSTLAALFPLTVNAVEIIHYQNIPVTIELVIGQERTIQFGDHVQVGITKGQQIKKLFRVQSAQGAVHFKPYEEFDKQRVQIKRLGDGKVILIDLVAVPAKENKPPLEVVKVILASENRLSAEVESDNQTVKNTVPHITPIDLTRFVAQKLYGPSRLYKDKLGIIESTLASEQPIFVFKGVNKHKTVSTPIVAFEGGGYYLAGIYIRNLSAEALKLNYLDINLPFSHATFQHHTLTANGNPGDSTVLYLITERPLQESLYPWSYYQDLKNADLAGKQ